MALDPAKDAERFWAHTIPEPNSGCLLWTKATISTNGYGIYCTGSLRNKTRKQTTAHRYACTLAHGNPPSEEHQALHKCDVKSCVEPKHLYWGTRKDNGRDASLRGRVGRHPRYGTYNGRAKLSENDVIAIRQSSLSGVELSRKYGVSKTHIGWIRSRRAWSHI